MSSEREHPPSIPDESGAGSAPSGALNRREFLRSVGAQAGAVVAGASALGSLAACADLRSRADVVVVGAGAFGGWTALYLREMGHRVTVVDAYGPGNSRATSGDETRGIRTGYGDKELWSRWASEAIRRWHARDQEWGTRLMFTTGDLILRDEWEDFLTQTRDTWQKVGVRHEVLDHDEIRYRYPQINADGITVALFEPDAGVARARVACLTVASRLERMGTRFHVARAEPGKGAGGRLRTLRLSDGGTLGGDAFVFALGPWFPKQFPEVLGNRIRIPMGHVFYYGTPPGDRRFSHPNLPSYNFPGVTGWPALEPDNRGFRVRMGGHRDDDPDTSVRWIDPQYHELPRQLLAERFPALRDAPLLETRCCHYELSSSRNFIVDRHPDYGNVWLAGGGSAEGFKFGPVIGEYIARRVTGDDGDPELREAFRIPEQTFDAPTPLPAAPPTPSG